MPRASSALKHVSVHAARAPVPEVLSNRVLLGQIVALALPVMVEHVLHIAVGLTDTYMANHLPENAAAGTAAVGTISYFLWFVGLTVTAVGTGSTAIIARARGARHRSLANSVCGQSIMAGMVMGLVVGLLIFLGAKPLAHMTRLEGEAAGFAYDYLTMLSLSVPFSTVMFVSNSCLRGAGDTLTPAISMVVVDLVNIFFTYTLTVGALGMPKMGFDGIAVGTVIAYIVGGLLQFMVLSAGRGGIRLHWHRLRPHWTTLKRVFRIGIPTGLEGFLVWTAQFAVVAIINDMDVTNRVQAAHNNAVRLEAFSYMAGFAISAAAATLVGQSLGARHPRRAERAAYLSYAVGGGMMVLWGLFFIFFGKYLAGWMSPDPVVAHMTAQCLFITGFVQAGFAASIVFAGSLRGAGDTVAVMLLNLGSIVFVRLLGVFIVARIFNGTLAAIWVVLSIELTCRGVLLYWRFLQGNWRRLEV